MSLAPLSQNKLLSPCDSHLPSPSLPNTGHRKSPGVRGREVTTTPHPSVILSLRGKSCQQHHTHTLRNVEGKTCGGGTYLGYFLCGIMGRISRSSLDSGSSSRAKRSEGRRQREEEIPMCRGVYRCSPLTCGRGGPIRPTQTNGLPVQRSGSACVLSVSR